MTLIGCQPAADPPAHRAPPATKLDDFVDVEGLSIEFRPDATIHLTGVDRWGAAIDTTYESIAYLRKALPTLERGLAKSQVDRLRAELARR